MADRKNHLIQKFSSEGVFQTQWGTAGAGDGQFVFPMGVAADKLGNIYVADLLNNRIQEFSSGGSFKKKWGSLGGMNGQFEVPIGIAVDHSGFLYALDWFGCSVQKFDLQWKLLYLPLLMK